MTTKSHTISRPLLPDIDAGRRVREQAQWIVGSRGFFWGLWSFIACVSLADAALVVVHLDEILLMEENPICRHLIRLDPTGLTYFLPAKLAGTATVLVVLRLIDLFMRRNAALITGSVAAYQAGLLVYLTCVAP